MDENSGNRFGRTIWTVWGYLSGAVARYLKPEVTDEGNQNVISKSDDTELKGTANRISREIKSNNSEKEENKLNENDKSTAEIKCSLPEAKAQVASVQWENTDVVKDDSHVKLHVDATKKLTYRFAVWSTGTGNGERTSGTDSNAHAEKETVSQLYVDSESKEGDTAQELEETGQIYGNDEKKEERDQNYEDETCAFKEEGDANMMVQTGFDGQDVEREQQMEPEETEGFGDFKDAKEYFFDEKEQVKSEDNQETKSQDLLPQQECYNEETDGFSRPEALNLEKKSETSEFSINEAEEMMLATEQEKEGETAHELEDLGQIEQKDGNDEDEECGLDHEDENCVIKKEDLDNTDVIVQSEMTDHEETEAIAAFKHADECFIEKNVVDQYAQDKSENDEDQDPESQVEDLLSQQKYSTEEADDLSRPEMIKVEKYSDEIAEFSKNEVEMIFATEQEEEIETEQEFEGRGQIEQKDVEDEECGLDHEDENCVIKKDPDNTDVIVQSELTDHEETEAIAVFKYANEKNIFDQYAQERSENDEDPESQVEDLLSQQEFSNEEADDLSRPEMIKVVEKYSDEIAEFFKNDVEMIFATEQEKEIEIAHELEELGQIEQKDGNREDEECGLDHEDENRVIKKEDLDHTDVIVQSELTDHEETEAIAAFKHADECLIEKNEKNVIDQYAQDKSENDEDQDPESQAEDLLSRQKYSTEEADDLLRPEMIKVEKYSDEIAEFSKNEVEMIFATEQEKEIETAHELEELGQIEQKDGNDEDEECGLDHEDENRVIKKENLDHTDVIVQSELTDHEETEAIAGFKHANEKNIIDQYAQDKSEHGEDQDPESQLEDLLSQQKYSTEEADDLSRPEMIKVIEKYSDEIAEFSKNDIEMILATEQNEESETEQEFEETGQPEQKDGNGEDEEHDGNHEDEKCAIKKYDLDDADEMVQKLKVMEKYSDETAESLKRSVGDIMHGPKQDENTSEQDTAKFLGSVETQPTASEEKNVSNNAMELKLSKAVDEMFYSEQNTSEDTLETGTGSPVVAIKTEGLFSNLIICDFPEKLRKESEMALDSEDFKEIKTNLHELQTEHLRERHLETVVTCSVEQSDAPKALEEAVEREQDIETQIKSLGTMETEMFNRSVELSELIDEAMETEMSSEDREAELFETESELAIFTNVAEQPHELQEFTKGECKPSQLITNTVSDSLAIAKTEHIGEELKDAKPVLTKPLSHVQFKEETVDLLSESEKCNDGQEVAETDLVKTALQFVEELTNQVLKEMIETEVNLEETETSVGPSTEELVLDEEVKFSETVDGNVDVEMEVENKQNDQTVSSPEFRCLKQQSTAVLSTEAEKGGFSGETDKEEHKEVKDERFPSKEGQAEILYANVESKERESTEELEKPGQIEQNDGNDEECDHIFDDRKCTINREHPDIAGVIIQEQQIDITHHREKKAHADESLIDEQLKMERNEKQELDLPAPADAVDLEEERRLLSQTMENKEVETISREVKPNDKRIGSTIDGRHEPIQEVIVGKAVMISFEELMEVSKPEMKRGFDQVSRDRPPGKTAGKLAVHLQALEDSSLDFTIQKSRIAVKNPLVRPPKNPRKLLHKPSVDPLPPKPSPSRQNVQITAPSKGVIGFKLPGLGAGLPVLRKTEFGKKAREGGEAENTLQTQQTSVAVSEDSVKQDQASAKPKWTPPRHPGMGGPMMMAELKNKLKKPVNE